MMQVDFGGLFGDAEHPADLPVGPSRRHQRGHLPFSRGERHLLDAVRVTSCGARSDCHREIRRLLGGHCPASVRHRTTYEFDVDHPECFASEDNGATPVEFVLVGLVGCLTAGVASVAQLRGIQLRSVTATIEGQMNVLGILGADPDIRNGFDAVTVRFAIDADASREDLHALIAQSQKRSAVFDIVTNPTKVLVELA